MNQTAPQTQFGFGIFYSNKKLKTVSLGCGFLLLSSVSSRCVVVDGVSFVGSALSLERHGTPVVKKHIDGSIRVHAATTALTMRRTGH